MNIKKLCRITDSERKLYDVTLNGSYSEDEAIEFLQQFDFSDCALTQEPMPRHCQFIDSDGGVGLYYDFGADYYFFTEENL